MSSVVVGEVRLGLEVMLYSRWDRWGIVVVRGIGREFGGYILVRWCIFWVERVFGVDVG